MMDDLEFIAQSAQRLFADLCTAEDLKAVEHGESPTKVWNAVAETGLPWASLPEDAGGGGGTGLGIWMILRSAGWHGAPIPIAETGAIAGTLLIAAGQQISYAPTTFSWPANTDVSLERNGDQWRLTGLLRAVPWARFCEDVVFLAMSEGQQHLVRLALESTSVTPRSNLAGEWRDDVSVDSLLLEDDRVSETTATTADTEALSALARSALMAGALERVSDMTNTYAKERQQFGRPIARFQAVQHQLVKIAEEAAAASLASQVAADVYGKDPAKAETAIASAKIVANNAADTVTAQAHQVHGAIGMTKEYPLHYATRRLWAWREESGSSRFWRGRLGAIAIDGGADRLWSLITEDH